MNIVSLRVLALAVCAFSTGILSNGTARADAGHSHGSPSTAAASGGPGKAADVKRVIKVEARDRDFSLRQVQVRPGETVRFVITNKSSIRHEFGIASNKEHVEHRIMMQKLPDMVHDDDNVVTLEPGETKEIVWKFGTDRNALKDLEFSCNIPGHAEQGMHGKFQAM
jgi:uncharacterized cupredoxin-like copper-binding protein